MVRLLKLLLAFVLVAAVAVGGYVFLRSSDPFYDASELVFHRRFHRYDALIADAAHRHGADPMLIKAVIWRESRFRPDKEGTSGERGLMQIGQAAAGEWAKSEGVGQLGPDQLFDAKTNIEAGTWLLARAIKRWQDTDNPIPFALAEYNAGRSRVQRWVAAANDKDRDPARPGNQLTGGDLQAAIGFPSTKQYVEDVQGRMQFYRQRGRL